MTTWIWKEKLGTISLLESMTEDGVVIVDVRDLSDVSTDVAKVKEKILIVANLLMYELPSSSSLCCGYKSK